MAHLADETGLTQASDKAGDAKDANQTDHNLRGVWEMRRSLARNPVSGQAIN